MQLTAAFIYSENDIRANESSGIHRCFPQTSKSARLQEKSHRGISTKGSTKDENASETTRVSTVEWVEQDNCTNLPLVGR